MDGVSVAASVIALIQMTTQLYDASQKYIKRVKHANEEITRFQSELKSLQVVLEALDKLLQSPQAFRIPTTTLVHGQVFNDCHQELMSIQSRLEASSSKRFMRSLQWPFTSEEVETKIKTFQRLRDLFDSALQIDQMSQIATIRDYADKAEEERLLSKLPYANGATHVSSEQESVSYCLDGTRTRLVDQIMAWAEDSTGKSIYWLYGMAGTGKSTIAKTIARNLNENKTLGASFFFSRKKGGDVLNANKFFGTVARQLAQRSRPLREAICKAIEDLPNTDLGLQEQWRRWILQPLIHVNRSSPGISRLVLVVDALDECQSDEQVGKILQTFASAFNVQSMKLLVFITSRPDIPICVQFREMPDILHVDLALHDVPEAEIKHDIRLFVNTKMTKIRQQRRLPSDWPDNASIDSLVDKCGRLFIYASTACAFVGELRAAFPRKRLESIIQGRQSHDSSPEKKLDHLYLQILSACLDGVRGSEETDEVLMLFQLTVGTIVTLFEPFLLRDLGQILKTVYEDIDEESMLLVIHSLHAVLAYSKLSPIQILHPSFQDFIFEPARCEDARFRVNKRERHHTLFQACISTMQTHLKKDICNLKDPAILLKDVTQAQIDKYISNPTKYSCKHWIKHFIGGGATISQLELVAEFFRENALFWIEGLSLLGRLSDGVLGLLELEKIAQRPRNSDVREDTAIFDVAYDLRRFILTNRSLLEKSPLQTYVSALIFAPSHSLVRQNYGHLIPDWFHVHPNVDSTWDRCLHTFPLAKPKRSSYIDETRPPCVVQPSSNSEDVSSALLKQTQAGEAETGLSIVKQRTTLVNNTKPSEPDRSAHTSVLEAKPTAQTYVKIQRRFAGQFCRSDSLAFSEDGMELGYTPDLKSFEIWNIITGALEERFDIHCPLTAATSIESLSPNGKFIAISSSWESNLELLDTETERLCLTIYGAEVILGMRTTIFSPNSNQFVVYYKASFSLWSIHAGTSQQRDFSEDEMIRDVVFSPNGELIAVALVSSTVMLLRCSDMSVFELLVSPECPQPLKQVSWMFPHEPKLAFSQSGLLLAHVDAIGVAIWDLSNGSKSRVIETRMSSRCPPCFSRNDELLAYASKGMAMNMVRVWHRETQQHVQVSTGDEKSFKSLAFSLSKTQLAYIVYSADEGCVKLWDLSHAVSDLNKESSNNEAAIWKLTLSPNAKYAACQLSQQVQIWNTATNVLQYTLSTKPTLEWGDYVVFTPDSSVVATVVDAESIGLWNTETGVLSSTVSGLQLSPKLWRPMSFSADSSLMAIYSYPRQIQIRHVLGGILRILKVFHDPAIDAVPEMSSDISFSPSGTFIATGRGGVSVWDVTTGGVIYNGPSDLNNRVSFSQDEKILLCYGEGLRPAVQIIDLATGSLAQTIYNIIWHTAGYPRDIVVSPDISRIMWRDAFDNVWLQTLSDPSTAETRHFLRLRNFRFNSDGRALVNERAMEVPDDRFSLDPQLSCINWKGRPVLQLPDTLNYVPIDVINNVYVFRHRFTTPMIFNFKTVQELEL